MELLYFLCEKKNAKLENETPSLVINYKPLNKLLKCILIQYPIQKKKNFKKFKKKI